MADNRQNLLNDISDGLEGIRAAINSSNVTIPEDTPLQDYEKYIREISKTHVDIGKQIFVFYTWAKTVDQAIGYDKPSIHWNETGDGWTVQETNDWQLKIPDNLNNSGSEPDYTYYTFVMFVSLSIKDSTGDGFDWPTPVQISGSKGERGEKGDAGKDGWVAGLILNTNINLYSLNQNIDKDKLTYDIEAYDKSSSYELVGRFLKYDNKSIENWSVDSQDSLFLTCPETNDPVYTLTVKVSSGTSNVEIIYGPTCQSISDFTIKYSNGDGEWANEASISKENPNLYAKVKTKFGTEERESGQVWIAKYPNEIENFSIIAYGTSWSTTEEPTKWQNTMPDMNTEGCPSVLWGKYRVEHLDSDKTTEINTPILHRGTAGIPYNLIMTFEDELDITDDSNNPLLWIRENWEKLSVIHNAIKAGNVVYMYVGSNVNENSSSYVCIDTNQYLLKLGTFGGTGTQMIEITYNDLKTLRSQSKLIPGMQYRIIDYITTTIQTNTQSAGHQFDIIVTADSTNTLNENARAIQHKGDTNDYFKDSDLNAWRILYCLDNDEDRFKWADDSVNGRGVIYRMIDEFNNDCPYDFKNIKFKHPKKDTTNYSGYYYTFTCCQEYETHIMDASIFGNNGTLKYENGESYGVYNNIIKPYNNMQYSGIKKCQELNNNVFIANVAGIDWFYGYHDNYFGTGCCNNSIEDNCIDNTFGTGCCGNSLKNYCTGNSFGNDCRNNSFGNACDYNSFGTNCTGNSFGDECCYNSFGNGCCGNTFWDGRNNTFGNACCNNSFGYYDIYNRYEGEEECTGNSFGNNCCYNEFGNRCNNNSFGNYCCDNEFGDVCENNSFGNGCQYNSFRSGESTESPLLHLCSYNHFDDGCSYNVIWRVQSDDYLENINVVRGVSGTSQAYNFIHIVDKKADYEIKVVKNTNKEIKI